MTLEELDERLGTPRAVELSRATWVAAAVLGLLRTAVNDAHRGARRSRGTKKNALNDLQGALGELVGLALLDLEQVGAPARGLLDLGGSVDLPDLTVNAWTPSSTRAAAQKSPTVLLDAKCHFDSPSKKLFLVNQTACERSAARGVTAFLPIATCALHSTAVVGRLVPLATVRAWRTGKLGAHHDPAHQVELAWFAEQFLGGELPPVRDQGRRSWGQQLIADAEFEVLAQHVGPALLEHLRTRNFSLDGLRFRGVRRALLDLVPPHLGH